MVGEHQVLRGTVHGRTIELDARLDVPDGQAVEVQVRVVGSKKTRPGPPPGWQEGRASQTAGILADVCNEDDDRMLEMIQHERKRESRRGIGG